MLLSKLNESVLMQELDIDTVTQGLTNRLSSVREDNCEIIRQLELAKFNLIKTLNQLPCMAAWIFNKYQTDIDHAEQEIEATTKRDEAFCAFSFEDLIELTDLVVYAFQARGLCYQTTALKKRGDWVAKRLKNLTRLKQSTVSEQLNVNFLSDDDLYQCVMNSITAEHTWLNLRQQLVENNTKLVLFIANQYKGGFLDFDDLVQEGQTGLLIAADKFDSRFGCQFSTYAAYWIRQRILRAYSRHERVVRVPCEQVGYINKLSRVKNEWWAKTGREPSAEELAQCLEMSIDEVNTILAISQTALPLENYDTDNEVLAPIDIIEQEVFVPPFKQMAQLELKNWLKLAIKTLNSRESKVVCCHFGLHTDNEMTLQEIGTELNISRERVRQIQVMAFNKMKLSYGEQLVSFL